MVEFQDSCALQFWWRHLKPNEQPATASTVSEVMMLAVLRSERKTFDIFAGSWYTTSNPCESVGGDCVAFPVLSRSWRSKQRRTIYRCIKLIKVKKRECLKLSREIPKIWCWRSEMKRFQILILAIMLASLSACGTNSLPSSSTESSVSISVSNPQDFLSELEDMETSPILEELKISDGGYAPACKYRIV